MTIPTHLHSNDTELSFIGLILLNPDYQYYLDKVGDKHFFKQKQLFNAVKKAYVEYGKAEIINVDHNRDEVFLAISKASLGSPESVLYLIYEYYIAREAYYLGLSITKYTKTHKEGQELAKQLELLLNDYSERIDKQEYKIQPISTALSQYIEHKANKWHAMTTTDFRFGGILDKYTLANGQLCSIVARTKAGKTTLLSQLAIQALNQSRPVLFVSLEVDTNQILDKMIAYKANINPLATVNYQNPMNKTKAYDSVISDALEWFSHQPLDFYHTPDCNLNELKMKIKEYATQHPRPIIFIDQLQFIATENRFENRIYQYDYIMRKIKQFALEYNCSIFLAHQLNRDIEKRENKFPQTSDIKDSGRIEEISDLLILFAQSKTENIRNCTIISRHMAGGYFELVWEQKKAKFVNIGEE